MLFLGGENFREWLAHETLAEQRRRVFCKTDAVTAIMSSLTSFAEKALSHVPRDADTPNTDVSASCIYRKNR